MHRILYLFCLFFILLSPTSLAQTDSSHLRLSLLTCGSGPEPWETFGHTAIRVTDSSKGTDNVYNYGTFNGYDENFLIKFTRGKLLYYVSYYPYQNFVQEYAEAHRSVKEQLLLLDEEAKKDIADFLEWNSRDENKYYKYDFFFDNCATRQRDIFPRVLGANLQYGYTLPKDKKLSFRNIINQYFYRVHWQRFGVNILLGSKIDQIMSNKDVMFLPDFLSEGIAKAKFNGTSIAAPSEIIVAGAPALPSGINGPFIAMMFICLLTIAGLSIKKLESLGKIMSFIVLFITGFIGWFIIVMWFGTDHQACQNNYNLLWALPTNLFLAFAPKKRKDRYAIVAILLIAISILLHVLKVQELPLLELFPLLLALLFVFGNIYRNQIKLINGKPEFQHTQLS